MSDECAICAKDRGGADELFADEHVVVSHLRDDEPTYLGYLFVETRRHVAELGELDDEEAAGVGRAATRASAALQRAGAEHVYAAVIGHGVAHLHVHLIARWPGTPREYWWVRVDEWPGAPRGDAAAVAAFVDELRQHLAL